jgi:hypothetical protein
MNLVPGRRSRRIGTAAALLLTFVLGCVLAQVTPGFNHLIPANIMTPDVVETRLGTLRFDDGRPDADTSRTVLENLTFMRAVETFLNGIPATSIEGMRRGMVELGATASNKVLIMDDLMDSAPLFLTGNTDTVYAAAIIDLQADGPTVVEIPAGTGPGTVNDAFFRFVVDMGAPGPDAGQGGKYLIVPADFDGELPDGYFVARSPSYVNWLILRGFLVDGSPETASRMFREGLKVYPLARADNPPAMEFINGSRVPFNTIHANNYEFYEELHDVLEREPVGFLDPELRGLFASVGIRKGAPFSPDDRMRELLTEAVAVGNATARALVFNPPMPGAYVYDNSHWQSGFIGGSYEWLVDGGEGGRNLDARTYFFYVGTVNTPAMAAKMVGRGSQYAFNAKDSEGNFLDGDSTYRLNIPADVPAADFWSVVAYDPQTRSELQTSQPFPSKNNRRDPLIVNEDGSVDLYFGPTAPEGQEANWIETVPGKGWFVLLRLYGPLEPWFEQTWRPGEFELLD